MARRIDTGETHVRYLIANSRGGVRAACTCASGSPHGAQGYRSLEQAMATGRFDAFVPMWINDPMVTRMCRDYAEKALSLKA